MKLTTITATATIDKATAATRTYFGALARKCSRLICWELVSATLVIIRFEVLNNKLKPCVAVPGVCLGSIREFDACAGFKRSPF